MHPLMSRIQFFASKTSTLSGLIQLALYSFLELVHHRLPFDLSFPHFKAQVSVRRFIHSWDLLEMLWKWRLKIELDGALLIVDDHPDRGSIPLHDLVDFLSCLNVRHGCFQVIYEEEDFNAVPQSSSIS